MCVRKKPRADRIGKYPTFPVRSYLAGDHSSTDQLGNPFLPRYIISPLIYQLFSILMKFTSRVKDFNTILLSIKDFDTIIKIPIPFDKSNDFKDIFSLIRPFISA